MASGQSGWGGLLRVGGRLQILLSGVLGQRPFWAGQLNASGKLKRTKAMDLSCGSPGPLFLRNTMKNGSSF